MAEKELPVSSADFQLGRNAFGRLSLTTESGEVHEGVIPVRAFPIGAPDRGLSLVSIDGHELAWIESLQSLPEPLRGLVEEELASREFMPEIQTIIGVSGYVTPCTWTVQTARGQTSFVLKGEEDIRRLGPTALLVSDNHGIQFLIRSVSDLDRHSRKILDRFL